MQSSCFLSSVIVLVSSITSTWQLPMQTTQESTPASGSEPHIAIAPAVPPSSHRRGPSLATSVTSNVQGEGKMWSKIPNRLKSTTADLEANRGGGAHFAPSVHSTTPAALTRRPTELIPLVHPGIRAEMIVFQSELIGTMAFLIGAFGGCHAASNTLELALSFALSLAVAVFLFGKSLLNPAVVIAQTILGELAPLRAVNLITAELVGAIAASGIIKALTGKVQGHVQIADGTSVTQALFIESIATLVLVYTVVLLTHQLHQSSSSTPFTVGAALAALELFAIPLTSGALNAARALGPSVVSGHFAPNEWVYYVSSIIGGVSAAAYYKFTEAIQQNPLSEPAFGPALARPTDRVVEEEG